MNGHVKIHRKILDWEWWDDVNTFRLFMTILLMVNWEDKTWKGRTIPRGSMWTSLSSLAKCARQTNRQARTALNHLISTGEVTCETTNQGMLVTVANYDVYQSKPRKATSKTTSEVTNQATNQATSEATTTKEYKNNKEGEEGSVPSEDEFIFFKDIK